MISGRSQVVATCNVGVGERDVAADHIEACVAQDPLEREHVAAVDKVVVGERVAEGVRRATPLKPCAGLEAFEDLLDPVEREPGSGLRQEDGLVGLAPASLRQIPPNRPARTRSDGYESFLRALAHHLDRAVGPQVTESDARRLRHAQTGIEEKQEDRLVASARPGEKLAEFIVVQRLDELARYSGLGETADGHGLGELFGREPVAEHMQAADVACNAHRRERGPKLDEPGAPGRRFYLIEDRVSSKACDRPAKDVAIPAHRSGR